MKVHIMHIAPTVLLALLVGTKVTAAGNAKTEVPELTCYTGDGSDYRGRLNKTINGLICQAWSSQTHSRTKEMYLGKGLEENFCRNPDGMPGPWCYTKGEKCWELCKVPRCPAPFDLTDVDKQNIVIKHNQLRRDVQPPPSNMMKMTWNEEAAVNAHKWAMKCTTNQSPVGERTTSTDGCGENLFKSSVTRTWDDAIQAWYDEIKDWEYGSVNGRVVGNFTQVVWYSSNQVGCAMAFCPNHRLQYHYVCHYCPAGNYQNIPPYKVGPSCGDCPDDCDDKLCTGNATLEVPELTCYTVDGRYYLGRLSNTINGRTCQDWSDQTPHTHTRTKENHQYRGLEENYCRNPDGELKPWCYTTDKWKRWEYCQVQKCGDAEVEGSTRDNATMEQPTATEKPKPTEPTEKHTEHTEELTEEPTKPTEEQKPAEKPKNTTAADNILNKHNQLRRDVQPTARNMLKMSWNKKAATNAQRWANNCTMKRSPRKLRTLGKLRCGENLFMSTNFRTWDTAIEAWYSEIKDWEYGKGAIDRESVVGHFTQVVWYRSNQLGCAMAHCPDATTKYNYYYVCHYCPAGNVGGLNEPYKLGPSCGDCPDACDDKLCTNPCPYKDKYSNCPPLKERWTCDHPSVKVWCPASCNCTTEII